MTESDGDGRHLQAGLAIAHAMCERALSRPRRGQMLRVGDGRCFGGGDGGEGDSSVALLRACGSRRDTSYFAAGSRWPPTLPGAFAGTSAAPRI